MHSKRIPQVVCGLVLGLLLAGAASADISTGIVGYWPLDGNAQDASGNGLDGTIHGEVTPAPDRLGRPDSAMSFTGASNCNIEVADAPLLQLTGEMTLAAWVLLNGDNTNNSRILAKSGAGGARSYSLNIEASSGGVTFPATFQIGIQGGASNLSLVDTEPLPTDEWVHMAGVYRPGEAMELYVNGDLHGTRTGDIPPTQHTTNGLSVMIGARNACSNCGWTGLIDEARIYARALSVSDIRELISGQPGVASDPVPENEATDVPVDAELSWTAGQFAATHNLYLGTVFQDVNEASLATPRGVLAGAGLDAAAFAPGPLAFGKTYFWRVDEVNAAPDNMIYRGNTWFFTTEPYGYPVTPVAATASSAQVNMGPEKTLDGSGLTQDRHGTEPTTMWLSAGTPPNWIQYEFDQVYKLNDLKVWNSNQLIESFLGFGAKDVTIETSLDGTTWTPVADVPEFARAPGAPDYAANTTVNLGGAMARYVKLTINTNWGGTTPQTGLAEVQFSYVPTRAFAPEPANAATDVGLDVSLAWRPGRTATSHHVYFGTDRDAVAQGTVATQAVAGHSYTPGSLHLGATYFWRVDEVNAVTYPGDVWSFTTQPYEVVEDFESYTDKAGEEVFSTWIDGYDNPSANGAIVGLGTAVGGTFGETTIVHGGRQSMPLAYDNTTAPRSEATRTFAAAQDWTASGIKSLSLWFHGVADNTGQLYVKINGTKVPYSGSAADLASDTWTEWKIDLSQAGNVSSVRSLTIGIDGAGARGALYLDDVRLYP